MNIVNRILVIIALIAGLIAVTAVCLFPDFFVGQLVLLADALNGVMPRVALIDRLILLGIAAVVNVGLIVLLALEFYRPRAKEVRISKVEGGEATVTVDSIRQRLGFYIDGLADVVTVKPKVLVKGNKVAVEVDVQTSAVVNVPAKAREVVSIVEMVVRETMGLELRGTPVVRIRTGSYRELPLAAIPAAPGVPAQEPPAPSAAVREAPAPSAPAPAAAAPEAPAAEEE